MREGPVTDPAQRQELEQSLQQTRQHYQTIHDVAHTAMLKAAEAGDQTEADRQTDRSSSWLRQVVAIETTIDTLRRTGVYRVIRPAEPEPVADK